MGVVVFSDVRIKSNGVDEKQQAERYGSTKKKRSCAVALKKPPVFAAENTTFV